MAIDIRNLSWSPELEAQRQQDKAAEREAYVAGQQQYLNNANAAANANYDDLAARALAEKMFGSYSAMNTDGDPALENTVTGINEHRAILGDLGSLGSDNSTTTDTSKSAPPESYTLRDSEDSDSGNELLSATDAVNQAFNEGVQQAAANHSIAKQTQAQQAARTASNLLGKITNPMNMIQRQAASQLQGYKQAWANYNDAYNRAMEAGDEDTANQYLAQRDKIAGQADSYRQQLNAAGVTLGDAFGANGTLEQAQQVLGADRLAGLNRILGDGNLSSDDVYNRDYQNYINAGASKRQARKWAAENAGNYRLQRISQLNNALGSYGVEADGSINSIGTNIIAAMAREGDTGGLLQSALRPGVKDVWGVDQQRQAREDQFNYDMAKIMQSFYNNANLAQIRSDLRGVGGAGGSSGGTSGGSSGSRSRNTTTAASKEPEDIKQMRKRLEEYTKENGPTDYDNLPDYLKAASHDVNEYDQGVAYNRVRQLDFDDYGEAIQGITAMLEGRAGDGHVWSPSEVIDALESRKDGDNDEYMNRLITDVRNTYGG